MDKVVIFVPLLNEGTDVWRPVEAELLPDGRYRIVSSPPESETWAVSVGSVVSCRLKVFSDGIKGLAAGES